KRAGRAQTDVRTRFMPNPSVTRQLRPALGTLSLVSTTLVVLLACGSREGEQPQALDPSATAGAGSVSPATGDTSGLAGGTADTTAGPGPTAGATAGSGGTGGTQSNGTSGSEPGSGDNTMGSGVGMS